jgi:hypothetical protein
MCDHHHFIPVNSASIVEHTKLTIYFKVPIWTKKTEGKPLLVMKKSQHMNNDDLQRSV